MRDEVEDEGHYGMAPFSLRGMISSQS
jgi:hypothetical protein